MLHADITRVVADIGGTNIRLARAIGTRLEHLESHECRRFPNLEAALRMYLERHSLTRVAMCVAVASPVRGDTVSMTNLAWRFSRSELQANLGLQELLVVNDYSAIAMAVPHLPRDMKRQIGGGFPQEQAPIAVCGPGTGLGVAHLVYSRDRWLVLAGEGGHADLAQHDELEQQIFNHLRRDFDHVSAERILSGPGLARLYEALCVLDGQSPDALEPAEISARALDGSCRLCMLALARFCAILGSFCGDLALTLGTFGGVYLAGGILPDMAVYLEQSEFRRRFEDKGRYRDYNAAIPCFLITDPQPGLRGAAAWLDQHLAGKPQE